MGRRDRQGGTEGTREVLSDVEIRAVPEQVFSAFTDVDLMRSWWGLRHGMVEKRVGGVWACAWDAEGFGFVVLTGVVKIFKAGERLGVGSLLYFHKDRPVLGPMSLDVEVSRVEGGTSLRVLQAGYGQGPDWDWYHALVVENWPKALRQLREFLEGRGRGRR